MPAPPRITVLAMPGVHAKPMRGEKFAFGVE